MLAAACVLEPSARHRALSGLAPYLSADLARRALSAVTTIDEPVTLTRELSALALVMPDEQRGPLLEQAVAAATAIHFSLDRVEALAALAPHLTDDLRDAVLTQALSATGTMDSGRRLPALSVLAPLLPPGLLPRASKVVDDIQESVYFARARLTLAVRLEDAMRDLVLAETLRMLTSTLHDYPAGQVNLLADLAPILPADLLLRALDISRAIPDDYFRTRALGTLIPHLPDGPRDLALAEALRRATLVEEPASQVHLLVILAPQLPTDQRDAVLAQAMTAVTAIDVDYSRSHALTTLAPHLPPPLLERVLDEALALDDPALAAQTLAGLGAHLPADLLPRALSAALAFGHHSLEAVIGLAPYLPVDLLQDAFAAYATAHDPHTRAQALSTLATHLPAEHRATVLEDTLEATSLASRHLVVGLLPAVLSVATDPDTAAVAASALHRVCRWWP
jgi:hypothetical protein